MTHPEPTPSDVQEILDTSLNDASLQAHIDAADHEVEDVRQAADSISDSRLTDIHKYLAAWYATGQEPELSSQSGESRSLSYAQDESANYRMLAMRLDPTNTISSANKPDATLGVPDSKGSNDRINQ